MVSPIVYYGLTKRLPNVAILWASKRSLVGYVSLFTPCTFVPTPWTLVCVYDMNLFAPSPRTPCPWSQLAHLFLLQEPFNPFQLHVFLVIAIHIPKRMIILCTKCVLRFFHVLVLCYIYLLSFCILCWQRNERNKRKKVGA